MKNETAQQRPKIEWKQELFTLLIILSMVFVQCVAINGLYKPNGLVSGGFTGIGMLVEYALAVPAWLTLLVLNIPVLILALWLTACMGLTAGIRIPFDFEDPVSRITSALLGAVICGACGAPIIRRGASGGGTDVIALLLNRRFSFPMGSISLGINLLIIAGLALIRGLDVAALSIVVMFVSSVAFNNVMQGLNRTKTLFIISDHWEQIAPPVLAEVHRGVTLIPAKGAYTGRDKTLVYVIARTTELSVIRRIVREIDPEALISIIDTREVLGRGFGSIN